MPNDEFPRTSWNRVALAGADTPAGRKELAILCKAYWFPVYAFIRRRVGSADKAGDRTQGFFARLIEKNDLAKVDRTRGKKFRSWLLRCVKNYLSNEYDYEHAQIRDESQVVDSPDAAAAEGRYLAELSDDLTPERLYERHFAQAVLARVLLELCAQYAAAGKQPLFEALKGCLSQDTAQRPYEEVAIALNMTVAAVKKAAFDLRDRYKRLLRAEVARLVKHPEDRAEVDEELRRLRAALED